MPAPIGPTLLCVMLLASAWRPVAAQGGGATTPWRVSGSYVNILSRSRTVVPPEGDFTFDLNRLRLRLEGEPVERISVDVQNDLEVLLGSYVRTAQYALFEDRGRRELDHEYASRDVVVRHRLYRATASWSGSIADITIGRQRVPLGTGQFWSALDLLNPIDPTRLERDYRAGVDGVLVAGRLGALARLDAVYAPATDRSSHAAAGYLHWNLGGWDYSVLAGTFRGDDAVGADFAGAIGGLGIRGEGALTRPGSGPTYGRALIGADYGFQNTLTLTIELYFNGQGRHDPARYDFAAVLAGRTISLARYYGAVAMSYQLTPLARPAVYAVWNIDDGSGVVWPRLEYSAAEDLEVSAGIQGFLGSPESEFGRLRSLLHGEARWFF